MTPTQIALVTATWRRCQDRRPMVHDAVAATLPADDGEERANRAASILHTVDRLHPLLARPGDLEQETEALIGDWALWTLHRRATTETALLTGLATALGPLPVETEAAWRAALDLFHEILAQLVLRPFGATLYAGPMEQAADPTRNDHRRERGTRP